MSFIDNIRMAQLYPAGANNTGSGVFGTPQINRGDNPFDPQPDPITEFAQRILPLIHGEQDRQRTFQQQDQQASNTNRLTDIANAAQHPDVVFRDNQTIRPLDAAKLAQNQQKIDETKSKDTGTLSLNKSKLNETKDHNDATEKLNQFKAMHPNMQILHPKGGNFQFLDPITHTMIDSGISTGTFTDEEMANTNQTNALAKIDATGRVNANNATALETQRQRGRESLANTNNQSRIDLKNTPAPLLPGQLKTDMYNKAQQLVTTDPSYAKYLTLDPQTNSFSIVPGTDEETVHKINLMIYGSKTNDINLSPGKTNKLPSETKKADPAGIR